MSSAEQFTAWMRDRLGYEPRDAALFARALTHRSAAGPSNERLELLGDSVLNLVVTQYLYEHFARADEGELSRLRSRVVSGAALAQLAATLALGELIALGAGELKSGGFRRASILADALEAIVGALYLEAGLDGARAVILRVLGPALAALDEPAELKDPKTRLQEWLQARGLPLPRYSVEAIEGEAHAQYFHVTCEVEPMNARAQGEGNSRRGAEQVAAQSLLAQLGL